MMKSFLLLFAGAVAIVVSVASISLLPLAEFSALSRALVCVLYVQSVGFGGMLAWMGMEKI